MITTPETVDEMLSDLQGKSWVDHLAAQNDGPVFARLTQALPGVGLLNAASAFKTIAARVPDLVRLDLGAVLVGGWKKIAELRRYADPHKQSPDETVLVKLGEHTVTSTHKPSLDVVFDGVKVDTVPFELKLTFTLEAVLLTIRAGEILAASPGQCKASTELKCEGYSILKKELTPVRLPGQWTFKPAIKIRDEHDKSVASGRD